MLRQLGPSGPAAVGGAAKGGLAGRPSLQAAPQDFDAVWGRVRGLVTELLENPLAKPSVHLMTGHQLVYRIAGGSCSSYPADIQSAIAKYQAEQPITTAAARSAAGPNTGQSRSPYAMLLRDLLLQLLRDHLGRVRDQALAPMTHQSLLDAYVKAWRLFGFSVAAIGSVFSYAHTAWYSSRQRGEGTRVLAEQIWRETVYDALHPQLIQACLDAVSQDRDGIVVERHVVRSVAESFTRLSGQPAQPLHLYQVHLEASYLRRLEDFLGRSLLQCREESRGSTSSELNATVRVLQAEVDRADKMLHPSTSKPLMKLITQAIPVADRHRIFTEVRTWAADDAKAELGNLYWLARHTDGGFDLLADAFATAVESAGRSAVDAAQGPIWFAHAAVTAVAKAERIIKESFDSNRCVLGKSRDAFTAILNDNVHTRANGPAAAELLASFSHITLRPGAGQAQADLLTAFHGSDAAMDATFTLLRYLTDRDVFQALYAKHLSTRVLAGIFTAENEHSMISGIAGVVTQHDFCYKWRRMLTDVERSNELRQALKDTEGAESASSSGIDFRPLVATQGTWPLTADPSECRPVVPRPVEAAAEAFARFYLSKAGERKRLVWAHTHASAIIRPTFTKRRHDITVSFPQACLLLGPDYAAPAEGCSGPLTPAAVAAWCGVPAEMLVRPLAVLDRLKIVKITNSAAGTNVDETTSYEINTAFAAAAQKINAQSARDQPPSGPAAVKPVKEVVDTTQRVVEDRKFAVQAAIVRVCKSRKSLKFQLLVAEVIKILQQSVFTPTVQLVKANIEALIDKEYLERSADDFETIDYLA